jgi:hypothetical protein
MTNPPVFTLIMVTNFFAIAFGFIFKDMLEYQVAQWGTMRVSDKIRYNTPNIVAAYGGLTLFTLLCMGASLSVFGLGVLAYGVATVVVVPTAVLVWVQLGSMLKLMMVGGSAAIDIDTWGEAESAVPPELSVKSKG